MQDSKRDTDIKNRLLDSVGEGEGGMVWENSIETCILPYVKQIANPGFRNEMGREGEGGFRMGNTRTPMADSCQVWQKPLQYCKVMSLQLK